MARDCTRLAAFLFIAVAGTSFLRSCEAALPGIGYATDGGCPAVYVPTCGSDGKRYFSPCEAEKANATVLYVATTSPVDNSDWVTEELCSELVGAQCNCPMENATVTGADGFQYLNGCAAVCSSTTVAKIAAAPCPANYCAKATGGRVCAPGGRTFMSACEAKCAGFPGPYKAGACVVKACDNVAHIKDPICVLKAGAVQSIQYQNPCYAMAAGFNAVRGDRYFKGNCNAVCDAKCNPRTGSDLKNYKELGGQVCCDPGVEHISPCYAACLTGASLDTQTCSKGACKGPRAAYLLANTPCPAGAAVLTCKSDLCAASTINCPNRPGAVCVGKVGCRKFFRFDYQTKRCDYSILDGATGSTAPSCTIKQASSTTPTPAPVPAPGGTCSALGAACFNAASLGPSFTYLNVPCCSGLTCQTSCPSLNGMPCVGGTSGTCVKTTAPVTVTTNTVVSSTPAVTANETVCAVLGASCFDAASLGPRYRNLTVNCCSGLTCQTCVSTPDMPCVGGTRGTCVKASTSVTANSQGSVDSMDIPVTSQPTVAVNESVCAVLGASCFNAASLGPRYRNLTVNCCSGLTCQTCVSTPDMPCVGGTTGTCVAAPTTVAAKPAPVPVVSTPTVTVSETVCAVLGASCFNAASLGPRYQNLTVNCCSGLTCQTCVPTRIGMPCVGGTNGTCVASTGR